MYIKPEKSFSLLLFFRLEDLCSKSSNYLFLDPKAQKSPAISVLVGMKMGLCFVFPLSRMLSARAVIFLIIWAKSVHLH